MSENEIMSTRIAFIWKNSPFFLNEIRIDDLELEQQRRKTEVELAGAAKMHEKGRISDAAFRALRERRKAFASTKAWRKAFWPCRITLRKKGQ